MEQCIGAEYYVGFAAPTLTARMMFRLYSSALLVREREAMLAHDSSQSLTTTRYARRQIHRTIAHQ